MGTLIGLHRIDDQQFVHVLSESREIMTHPHTTNITVDDLRLANHCWIDFHIETVELAQSTRKKILITDLAFGSGVTAEAESRNGRDMPAIPTL